jgi:hypothetical protein
VGHGKLLQDAPDLVLDLLDAPRLQSTHSTSKGMPHHCWRAGTQERWLAHLGSNPSQLKRSMHACMHEAARRGAGKQLLWHMSGMAMRTPWKMCSRPQTQCRALLACWAWPVATVATLRAAPLLWLEESLPPAQRPHQMAWRVLNRKASLWATTMKGYRGRRAFLGFDVARKRFSLCSSAWLESWLGANLWSCQVPGWAAGI